MELPRLNNTNNNQPAKQNINNSDKISNNSNNKNTFDYPTMVTSMLSSLWKKFSRSRNSDYFFMVKLLQSSSEIDEKVMDQVLEIMSYYTNDPAFSQVCCHVISNIALREPQARYLVEHKALVTIAKALQYCSDDPKLVWKAASAVWNLSRPLHIGDIVPDNLPYIIFECLEKHKTVRNAVYTCIGALSNLAIAIPEKFFHIVDEVNTFEKKILDIVLNFVEEYDIPTHAAALVANMAVNSTIANKCTDIGYVQYLVKIVSNYPDVNDLVKHVCAALHNLSDCDGFLPYLCEAQGIETLYQLNCNAIPDDDTTFFLTGIYEMAGIPNWSTMSLHVAAHFGFIEAILELLQTTSINARDLEHCTAIQRSIKNQQYRVTEFLIACGANIDDIMINDQNNHSIRSCIENGKRKRTEAINNAMLMLSNNNKNDKDYVDNQDNNVMLSDDDEEDKAMSNIHHNPTEPTCHRMALNDDMTRTILTYIPGIEVLQKFSNNKDINKIQ